MAEHAIPTFADGFSTSPDVTTAVQQVLEQFAAREPTIERPDFLCLFISGRHAADTAAIATALSSELGTDVCLAVSAQGVAGRSAHAERTSGVAALAGYMPGVAIRPFTADTLDDLGPRLLDSHPPALTMAFADPFSVAAGASLRRLSGAVERDRPMPNLIGGLASGGDRAGENVLFLNGEARSRGIAGLHFEGDLGVRIVISQMCRPVGDLAVVTDAKANLVQRIGGRPAVLVARDALSTLPERDKNLLPAGVFLGAAIDANKSRLGLGDYVMRRVIGVDENTGALAVNGAVRPGQTVRFHVRDRDTGREDLQLLLDGEAMYGPPAGVLMVAGRRRDDREPSAAYDDAKVVQSAFGPATNGPAAAKAGTAVSAASANGVPLAGFSTEGEIATIGDRLALHEQTVCLAVFRGNGTSAETALGSSGLPA